jgi:hypothetical protein
MAGKYWRLLAALSLILPVPALVRGQDRVDDWNPPFSPELGMSRSFAPNRSGPFYPPPVMPRHSPVATGTIAFDRVVSAAGIIFSGRVTSVSRTPLPTGESPPSTAVTFQVDQAVRGVLPGQNLTIHEWAGLWDRGERYRVGERVMLFLYSPSKLGLTSPVAGATGRFAVDAQGKILLNQQHSESFMTDPILGRKTVVPYQDFVVAVRRSGREE